MLTMIFLSVCYLTWMQSHNVIAKYLTGYPKLMGSLTNSNQLDLDHALADRNKRFNVDHKEKAELRKEIVVPGLAASMSI